jgi:hypothetical protein
MLSRAWTALLLLTLTAGCNLCGNQEISRIPSPDGKIEAVIFERDCATTDFSTQISILPKGSSVHSGVGNAFIGDSNHGAAPAAKWGGPPATRMSVQQSSVEVRTGLIRHEKVTVEYSPSL